MQNETSSEAIEEYRARLGDLAALRIELDVSWRTLASLCGSAKSTVEGWLRKGSLPDEPAGVEAVADYLLTRARRTRGVDAPSRLVDFDWRLAHAAAVAEREKRQSPGGRLGVSVAPAASRLTARVDAWSAEQLGVHPAIAGRCSQGAGGFVLPPFIERDHDLAIRQRLENARSRGYSAFIVVKGPSCCGKTRSAYEAVRSVLPDWMLFAPVDTRDLREGLGQVQPRRPNMVVWLDDLHRFFDGQDDDATVAAIARHLAASGRSIVVATVWPEVWEQLRRDRADSRARLMKMGTVTDVPERFTHDQVNALLGDRCIDSGVRDVLLGSKQSGEVCQNFAAGVDLLDRWANGSNLFGRAIVDASADAYLRGLRTVHTAFLRAAAPAYIADEIRATASADWLEDGLTYATEKVKGVASMLVPLPTETMGTSDHFRLADIIAERAWAVRGNALAPAGFWSAVHDTVQDPDSLARLANDAKTHALRRIAHELLERASELGHASAPSRLASLDRRAGLPAQRVNEWLELGCERGDHIALQDYEYKAGPEDQERVLAFWSAAAETGDTFAIGRFAWALRRAGRSADAEEWFRRGAELGDEHCQQTHARSLARAEKLDEAEVIWRDLAARGDDVALWELLYVLRASGRAEECRAVWEAAFRAGARGCGVVWQAGSDRRVDDGLHEVPWVEWLRDLAESGDTGAMKALADLYLPLDDDDVSSWSPDGDDEEYEEDIDWERVAVGRTWLERAAAAGDSEAQRDLTHRVPRDREALQADLRDGEPEARAQLASRLEDDGDLEQAEVHWRRLLQAPNESGTAEWAISRLVRLVRRQGRAVASDPLLMPLAQLPMGADVAYAVATELESSGRVDEAEVYFRLAAKHDTWDEHDFHLADFLLRHGRRLESEAILRGMLLRPSHLAGVDEHADRLLTEFLERSGRHAEVDRLRRFGLEPDGSTSFGW